MFGWFRPECPIPADDQHWLEWRMTWLSEQFGLDFLRERTVVLPTDDFFPDPYDATPESVRMLLDRTCSYMDVDPQRVDLDFYSQREPTVFDPGLVDPHSGAAGLYDDSSGRITIWLEAANLDDPADVVATLAHELGHVHLLGDGRLSGAEPDHEPLTDLLTVYCGMGVFTANAVLRDSNWRVGNWEGWSVRRQGYLTARLFGYALALFAWYRGERAPSWASPLRPDVRSPLKKGLRFLEASGFSTQPCRSEGPEKPPGAFPAPSVEREVDLFEPTEPMTDSSADNLAECLDPESADACVARGVVLTNQGDLASAIGEFTRAIEINPADGEAYLFRAEAYLAQERFRQALADANQAIRLDPDDINPYRVRGIAFLRTNDPTRAEADFSRILEDDPEDAAALYHRGLAHSAQQDFRQAVADFTKAIKYAPQLVDCYSARAEAYQRLGRLEEAAADREEYQYRARRLKPA